MAARKQQTKKNPTNAEIMLAVQSLQKVVNPLLDDVASLKQWQRDQQIAKAAVAEYVKENPPAEQQAEKSDQWLNRELVKTLGVALAVILALVTLIAQLKGVQLK
jgi:hypothetical protein